MVPKLPMMADISERGQSLRRFADKPAKWITNGMVRRLHTLPLVIHFVFGPYSATALRTNSDCRNCFTTRCES